MDNRHFYGIDALRGTTIMIIVFFHTCNPSIVNIPIITTAIDQYGGYFGNYTFFMLSGFLVSFAYKEPLKTRSESFGEWIGRRLIKLYPLFLITNLLVFGMNIWVKGIGEISIEKLALVLSMQAGGALSDIYPFNVPTWFICTLMICYISYYSLAIATAKMPGFYTLGLTAIALWGCVLMKMHFDFPYLYVHTGEGLSNFYIGALLSELYSRKVNKNLNFLIAISLICIISILALSLAFGFKTIGGDDPRIAISFFICPSVVLLCVCSETIEHIAKARAIRWFCRLSSGIFFWHLVLWEGYGHLGIMASSGLQPSLAYGIYIAFLITISVCSYRWLDPVISRVASSFH